MTYLRSKLGMIFHTVLIYKFFPGGEELHVASWLAVKTPACFKVPRTMIAVRSMLNVLAQEYLTLPHVPFALVGLQSYGRPTLILGQFFQNRST